MSAVPVNVTGDPYSFHCVHLLDHLALPVVDDDEPLLLVAAFAEADAVAAAAAAVVVCAFWAAVWRATPVASIWHRWQLQEPSGGSASGGERQYMW